VVQSPTLLYGAAAYGGTVAAPPVVDVIAMREGIMKSLDSIVSEIDDPPGAIQSHVVEGSGIADVLCESAETLGADLIVMGTHGRTGLAHVFLGSVAERTLRRAPCPVLVVQAETEHG
jgi:nucleotide-binding universal stress UspA family protein